MRFIIVLFFWTLISCTESRYCELASETDYAIVRFYRADTIVKTSRSVAFRSITEAGNQFYLQSMSDTINDDTLNAVALFVNPEVDQTSYIFVTDSITYELDLVYKKSLSIYDVECEPVYRYILDTLQSEQFDRVVLINPFLDLDINTNVEIYL